jgi:hypothetical protein
MCNGMTAPSIQAISMTNKESGMASSYHNPWQQEVNVFAPDPHGEIARPGSPQRPQGEPVVGVETARAHNAHNERMRQRVWRAVTWIVFANVLSFWLLTCITAFTPA